jgi:C1A family cysteine protease
VENQGALGSCTANALAGNLEFVDEKTPPSGYTDVSRLFIYYNERILINTVDYDSGAMLRDGIKTLAKQGVCSEKTLPYVIKEFAKKPSKVCYDEAKKHRIRSYHRILTHEERLSCLSEGYPFVFGFAVYESFESQAVARTGIVPMPKKTERMMGGHAVLSVGFDEKAKRFLARNSWGAEWGMGGYFTIPYEYLNTLAEDFWTIRK